MKLETLVIVDMQPAFSASRDYKTLTTIKKYVRLAKMLGAAVVVLEYSPWEEGQVEADFKTDKRIMKLLDGYKQYAVKRKSSDDGSKQVVEACKEFGFRTNSIFVTGVNTCACVARTVEGLSDKLPKSQIQVIRSACNCSHCDDTEWGQFPQGANIVVMGA